MKARIGLLVLVLAVAAGIYVVQSRSDEPSGAAPSPSAAAGETAGASQGANGGAGGSPAATPSDASSPSPSGSAASDRPSDSPSAPSSGKASPTSPDPSPTGELAGLGEETAAMVLANLPDETVKDVDGVPTVTNPDSLLVMANKKRNLPADYTPDDLTVPNVAFSFDGDDEKKKMREPAARALEKLFAGAKKAGLTLKAVSGYRSYARQKAIFDNNARLKGEETANRTSARPGQSEHQTGLSMDVSSASVGYALEESFAKTKEGKWLAAHAADYGFIIRYPKGKETITGYAYEPWHIRYVGKEVAKEIMDRGITLEEFFDAVEVSAKK